MLFWGLFLDVFVVVMSEKIKLIVLNSLMNLIGKVFSWDELDVIVEFVL